MRRIDHIVVAVHNLDGAGKFYHRLGFQVGTRNQHPWGTENRLIQFGSSFIELITIGSHANPIPSHDTRHFSFGAFIKDYLDKREGLAMLVLSSQDAPRDAATFARSGIGDFETFSFERNGVRSDGAKVRVAFSLAFARDRDASDTGFFVCQQHLPENFWDSRYQQHANGARAITAVAFSTSTPEQHVAFFTAFTGGEKQYYPSGKYTFVLNGGGKIELRHDVQTRQPSLTSFTVQVKDLGAMAKLLTEGRIPFAGSEDTLLIPSTSAFGTEIRFECASASGPAITQS